MGERQVYQPLTKEDKITVVLYRIGIVLSTVLVCVAAFILKMAPAATGAMDLVAYGLFVSVGMTVFFIHLYIRKFKVYLKYLYYIGLAGLALLLYIGNGSLSAAFLRTPVSALLLLPLAGCLGFVTAKEAFCFQLLEGYLLAMIMPITLVLVAGSVVGAEGAANWFLVIAAMLVLFTVRKGFMPLAYDIGDKSAYQ